MHWRTLSVRVAERPENENRELMENQHARDAGNIFREIIYGQNIPSMHSASRSINLGTCSLPTVIT